jgi:hypothetical protein
MRRYAGSTGRSAQGKSGERFNNDDEFGNYTCICLGICQLKLLRDCTNISARNLKKATVRIDC